MGSPTGRNAEANNRLGRLDATLGRLFDEGQFAGLVAVVWRKGAVIYESAIGWRDQARRLPMVEDAIFRIASMSKPVVSAAVLTLLEEGRLRLGDPLEKWLPELKGVCVLRTPASAIDDTVPLERSPTIHELMTHTAGFTGAGPDAPLANAVHETIGQMPWTPLTPDEFAAKVCALPLIQQPGRSWHYGVSTDLLGIIVARASGKSLPDALRERIFDPLGMVDTGFYAPPSAHDRLPVGYIRNALGGLDVHDDPVSGHWAAPPVFPSAGGGLVSTAADYLAFARMLLAGGALGGERVLSSFAVRLMTTNHLTDAQIKPLFPGIDHLGGRGFGLGVAINLATNSVLGSPGRYGFAGVYGTAWFADPAEELAGVIMSQVWLDTHSELRPTFENLIYQALDAWP